MPHSPLMKPEHASLFVLYDPADGRIFHIHRTVVYPGGRQPTQSEIEDHARDTFVHAQSLKRRSGQPIDAAQLKGLHLAGQELKQRMIYKVDLVSETLVEVPS